jgi:glycosyltransferase involved in cell wall biosynthesis
MPVLTLCMIVKNEERYLADCLQSVKGIADEIVIVDTGSTDSTIEIAQSYNANVHYFEWINDFSAARNYALSKSTGDWILYLDADERLDEKSKRDLLKIISSPQKIGYYCNVLSIDRESGRDHSLRYVRLFCNIPGLKFIGKVHEQIEPSLYECGVALITSKILINHIGYNVGLEEKQNKAKRNLFLLLEDYNHGKSPYVAYQLGLTYQVLNDDENAAKYFRIASESGKLERQYRAQCFTSLAFIAHQNHKTQEAEKNIHYSIKVDDRQPFSHLLASKISLRKNELVLAEERCKRAFILNQDLLFRNQDSMFSVLLDPEEVIYYGLTLALQNKNNPNYQFYQKELHAYYFKKDGETHSRKSNTLKKLFTNSSFTNDDVELLVEVINYNNLGFFIFMLGNNPYKQQVLLILELLLKKFPEAPEVQKLLAKLLDDFGRVQEAVQLLEKILIHHQDDPAIFFYLITYYLKLGKEDKIKPIVLQLEKNFSHVSDVMSRVRTLKKKLLMFTTVPM